MNFQELAVIAQRSGYDLITVEAIGGTTLVTCERRMGNKEPWTVEVDEPYHSIESQAMAEIDRVDGWDVRLTTVGIRAFGRQDNSRIDALVNTPYAQRRAVGGTATEFQPFSWRRADYNQPVEEPKRPKWHPCY